MPPVVNRSIFYGFAAWVGQTTGSTTCKWWPQDPNTLNPPFDANKFVETNLADNPYAVINSGLPLANLEVDNAPVNGGLTKIGATFPGGSMINSCWLEKGFYDALGANKPARIPVGVECREYELQTVYYWPGTGHALAGHRYWGFYAQIDSENGQNALVSIWPAGKSLVRGMQPAGAWWLNLAQVAHPIEAGITTIGVGLNPKQGALSLDAVTVAALGQSGPKLPLYCGRDLFPHPGDQ
jgi:hypothetical protein